MAIDLEREFKPIRIALLTVSDTRTEADDTSGDILAGRITTKGVYENVIHASSSNEDAEREIKLWFTPKEIVGSVYPTKTVTREKIEETVWA